MRRTFRRLAPPGAAAVVTSAIVAAIALAGSSGQQAPPMGGPPQPTGQQAGQLSIEGGPPIPVLSYSVGATQSGGGPGGGGGAGKVSMTDLSVVKPVDRNTPGLFLDVSNGRNLTEVTFTAQWGVGSGAATMVYELTDAFVTSVADSGAGGVPTEMVSFAFAEIEWTYTDASGTTTGCWDVSANTSC